LEILGYLAAILVGISLGLIGSGGSILTVPILVYLMGVNPVNATAYSLFIVGVSSLTGFYFYYKKKLVDFKTGFIFSIPAFTTIFLTRLYLLPSIPVDIFSIGNFLLTKQIFVMLLFAILMLLASISMIRDKREEVIGEIQKLNIPLITIEGIIFGILTGLVGAGGGFLIIPALVLLAKLPMKTAVGTSLLIISVNSLIGFLGDIGAKTVIEWNLILLFVVFAVSGIFIGSYLSKFITGNKLKPAFGWFVLSMSIYIITKEILKNY
jgi:uncharacterized protein